MAVCCLLRSLDLFGLRGTKGVATHVPWHKSNTLVCRLSVASISASRLRVLLDPFVYMSRFPSATVQRPLFCFSGSVFCLGWAFDVLCNWYHALTFLIARIRSCFSFTAVAVCRQALIIHFACFLFSTGCAFLMLTNAFLYLWMLCFAFNNILRFLCSSATSVPQCSRTIDIR